MFVADFDQVQDLVDFVLRKMCHGIFRLLEDWHGVCELDLGVVVKGIIFLPVLERVHKFDGKETFELVELILGFFLGLLLAV